MKRDTRIIATANLVGGSVHFAATAVTGVVSVRSTVQYSITAEALSRVVRDRLAAARVRPKKAISDCAAAARVRGSAVRFLVAARVTPDVDDGTAAASAVGAVRLRRDRFLAAQVRAVVVDRGSAAGRVPAVRAIPHRTVFAADRSLVVERRRVAAESVQAVGLVSQHAAAADLDSVVVRGVAAASGKA